VSYLAVAGFFALLASGGAQGGSPTGLHVGGIVPPPHGIPLVSSSSPICATQYVVFCDPVTFHGGVVMHATTTHAIYWLPSGYSSGDGMPPYDANYQTIIQQWFTDLQASSGQRSNVFGVDTQYCDGVTFGVDNCSGAAPGNMVTTNQTWGGSYTATNAFPSDGCTDPTGEAAHCLTDAQLQTEVAFALAQNPSWPRDTSNIYFLLTPEGVESCFDASGTVCGYTQYCAYHGSFSSSGTVVYANEPYPKLNNDPSYECGVGEYPNGADVLSHEHREAITDPNLDAWYDDTNGGYETSDQCAWYFGSESGPDGGKFNQTINGHHYLAQAEWSNSGTTCLFSYAGGSPTITKISPSHGVFGQPIQIKGKNLTGATDVTFNTTTATFTQVKSKLTGFPAVGTTTGPVHVTTAGGTADGPVFTVDPSPIPTITSFKPTATTVGKTVTVSGTGFWGTSLVTVNGVNVASFAIKNAKKLTFVVGGTNTTGTISITTPGGTIVSAGSLTIT
jgi:hypothetical protein